MNKLHVACMSRGSYVTLHGSTYRNKFHNFREFLVKLVVNFHSRSPCRLAMTKRAEGAHKAQWGPGLIEDTGIHRVHSSSTQVMHASTGTLALTSIRAHSASQAHEPS